MDDLDKLIPQPAELAVGGEVLAIRPLKVGRLPAFLRAISPTLQQLKAPSIDWLGLFIEHGDDLLQAVAIAADKPRAWVDGLAADEAILLAAKVVEVNADFFTRTVLPRLDGLFARVTQAAASGSVPSSA
ncbi:hypothetical protein HFK89_21870 [Ralstonia pseudosolanacearum]|uniref:hypothetical protein n=1 Tax=Ralstonia pseudosolanacearum TaxID=1310165 RepID=UPI0008F7EC46|nr:hypothetical protein [Ralstonia pseudosolanacearum]MCK4165031.1 hypothetical protein [Ralstonia pseudosolanacearum]OIN69197.1 hypothetical protein BL248_21830 [Ralstonia solanacearum]